MKKGLIAFEIIVLVLLIGVTAYTGYAFYNVSKQKAELVSDVSKLEESVSNKEQEISDINNEISSSKSKNEDKVKEYEKWQRHKEKLENLLGY